VHSRSVDDAGVGFAIPLSPARRRIIDQLLEGRPVRYGYLGLTVRELLPYERADLGLGALGLLVQRVDPYSAAAEAGVLPGDVITHFDQQPLTATLQFVQLVGQSAIGTAVALQARRDGQRLSFQVTVSERQVRRPQGPARSSTSSSLWRGMRLVEPAESGGNAAAQLAHDGRGGVMVLEIARGSAAERARIRSGDVIERVNDMPVTELPGFIQAVRGHQETVQLTIRDRGLVSISP
jgi:serine protease Do